MDLLILTKFVNLLVLTLLAPLLPGVINKTKAFFAGRKGPPLLQVYYDLFKLFRKGAVYSTTTTWVFRAGPVIGLSCVLLAVLFLPLVQWPGSEESGALLSFMGDPILVVYLLGLSRFFTALAALDTGSPFEGMGAAREVSFACLAEPAFLFGLIVLAWLTDSMSLATMLGPLVRDAWSAQGAALVLVSLSWFLVLLVENCRIPFDDPNTHLELTMIHEVMVLDHSGPAFGMILYGAALKLLIFSALLIRLLLPVETGFALLNSGIFLAGLVLVAGVVGVVESVMARLRLVAVPQLLLAACLLSGFSVVLLMR